MEILPLTQATSTPAEGVNVVRLEDEDLDRIAFELWQRSSLPDLAKSNAAELEEVASRSSCL